jgi:hypothetical protein
MLLPMSGLGFSTRCNHLACRVLHALVSVSSLTGLNLSWAKNVAEPLADLVCHSLLMLFVYLGSLLHKEDAGPGFFYIRLVSCGLLE